ncbi:hypothetical protein EB241_05675 [Erwinia psidii]|uniref:Uncharacterized protein n=2 Tax=Erwinia psidii TaxID=69224 RepID=A0A3N6SH48_9GAMM|nr:hypothetical protein EB241_05675 [Erwinia psidii]
MLASTRPHRIGGAFFISINKLIIEMALQGTVYRDYARKRRGAHKDILESSEEMTPPGGPAEGGLPVYEWIKLVTLFTLLNDVIRQIGRGCAF